jgi:hypothetical protein
LVDDVPVLSYCMVLFADFTIKSSTNKYLLRTVVLMKVLVYILSYRYHIEINQNRNTRNK